MTPRLLTFLALATCLSDASANLITNKLQASRKRALLSNFSPMTIDDRLRSPEVSGRNPGYIHFLLDSSESMGADTHSGAEVTTKAAAVSAHTNGFIRSLINRLTDVDASTGSVKPYFDISIRAYSSPERASEDLNPSSESLLYFLSFHDWHSIVHLATYAKNGAVAELEEPPIWVELEPKQLTNTREAMEESFPIIKEWARRHQQSHPPIVAHLTDGEYNSRDPSSEMEKIRGVTTRRGNAILFNAFISDDQSDAVLFPSAWQSEGAALQTLFEGSSVIPAWWVEPLRNLGFDATPTSRAFMQNGSIEEFHNVIEMGTRAAMGDDSSSH